MHAPLQLADWVHRKLAKRAFNLVEEDCEESYLAPLRSKCVHCGSAGYFFLSFSSKHIGNNFTQGFRTALT
jgi:hypothetical protein